ncbi:MAG: hypothetical protein D3910_01965 [Candidatus Electrothrix sp. ATG2]|nr:hypothetical protein [Candidatus Electrothrix sp. ATG2]
MKAIKACLVLTACSMLLPTISATAQNLSAQLNMQKVNARIDEQARYRIDNSLITQDYSPLRIDEVEIISCQGAVPACEVEVDGWDLWKVRVKPKVHGKPTHYMITDKENFAETRWKEYKSEFEFNLSPGTGEKTIRFKIRRLEKDTMPGYDINLSSSRLVPEIPEGLQDQPSREVELYRNSPDFLIKYRVNGTIRIASIGESYAAGEGAPDEGTGNVKTTKWLSQQCHRSEKNGRTLAVNELNKKLGNNITIDYRDFSCSGATINLGLLGPFAGTPDLQGKVQKALPPQLSQVKKWLGENRLDILLLSIGGNDIGFAEAVAKCISINPVPWGCGDDEYLNDIIQYGDPVNGTAKIGFKNLPAAYEKLDQEIDETLNPRFVLITEYPDLTRDHEGVTCGCKEVIDLPFTIKNGKPIIDFDIRTVAGGCYNDSFVVKPEHMPLFENPRGQIKPVDKFMGFSIGASALHLWEVETKWLRKNVLEELNKEIKFAAGKHGWIYVDGLMNATKKHGICARDGERWFNTLKDSWDLQGDIQGAVHPNEKGHEAYRDNILEKLEDLLIIGEVK